MPSNSNDLSFTGRKRLRHRFGRQASDPMQMPDLIGIQKVSYDAFLQRDVDPPMERQVDGLQRAFTSVFPISGASGRARLDFKHYEFDPPKFQVDECLRRGKTYAAPLKVTLSLIIYDEDRGAGARTYKEIKEQDVFMGDMPLMTDKGTFIINGTERVVVSQIHRAHGVFFDNYKKTTQSGEELLPQAHVIPARGSWLAFKIDGRKKDGYRMSVQFGRALERIPVTVLLRILGMTSEGMLAEFCDVAMYTYGEVGNADGTRAGAWSTALDIDDFRGRAPRWDLVDAADGEVIVPKDRNISASDWEEIAASGERRRRIEIEELHDIRLARDVVNMETGEIYFEAGECVGQVEDMAPGTLDRMLEAGIPELPAVRIRETEGPFVLNALEEECRKVRPVDLVVLDPGSGSGMEEIAEAVARILKITPRRAEEMLNRGKGPLVRMLSWEEGERVLRVLGDGRGFRRESPCLTSHRASGLTLALRNRGVMSRDRILERTSGALREGGVWMGEEGAERFFYNLFFAPAQLKADTVVAHTAPSEAARQAYVLDQATLGESGCWVLDEQDGWTLLGVSVAHRPPGGPATIWVKSGTVTHRLSENYDLSAVGRVKLNGRLGLDIDDSVRALRRRDVLAVVRTLVGFRPGASHIDDIDHLGNRRVRSVGELMENQYRMGLVRMERAVRERIGSADIEKMMPNDLINARPVAAMVREFFGGSQLSQFMDQTNPLAEVTHKRRLSALGPGGLTREWANLEARDVHPTHYGRLCPVETPEGPNIGLISSLATFAKINRHGFIETPYRKVEEGQVSHSIEFMTALDEQGHTIAQASTPLTDDGRFVRDIVNCRRGDNFIIAPRESIDYIDVSPRQLVSVSAALIPFLENDDANRALMGSNMQRQAVPLLRSEAPLIGTGMESHVARDSRAVQTAERAGVVDQVDARRIVVRVIQMDGEEERTIGVDIYNLRKFERSNQSTCINQRPLVKVGDRVQAGDVIADGSSTDLGELALGRNVLVAFMPWQGYNFEDSILVSERLVRDDVFTSIHIEEYEVMARDTKLWPEEITRDILNVGEEALRHLDETGIVHIGAEVGPRDILVGKVTPKGETPSTPEEKLLRAVFGEKAADVRDTSLRVPPGVSGTVVDVRIFSRRGLEKDARALSLEREEIARLTKDRDDELAIIEGNIYGRLRTLILRRTATDGPATGVISAATLESTSRPKWWRFKFSNSEITARVEALHKDLKQAQKELEQSHADKVEKVRAGDELLPGVLKIVKVYIAVKRKLSPGDKMAGRHGNKGVISKINPIEDMPHTVEGTPVDIVLNPLGVPSRMNVGQILETHLGWASAGLGHQIGEALEAGRTMAEKSRKAGSVMRKIYGSSKWKHVREQLDDPEVVELAGNLVRGVPIATPVFDGAAETDIRAMLRAAGCSESGQVTLIDGRTGEPFARPVTVGYIYMLKLHHLVDDKMHARSTGPYSLVTQQPLGGKARFGGQRFGEMEVWALQAYGAAYTLQEILTVKSDDVSGRTKMYEAIVRGEDTFEAGVPESFNVLVKELQALGLDVQEVHHE